MIDPKQQHEIEQAMAAMSELHAEGFPPLLGKMYRNLMASGFGEERAFELVKTYLIGCISVVKGE